MERIIEQGGEYGYAWSGYIVPPVTDDLSCQKIDLNAATLAMNDARSLPRSRNAHKAA